MVILGLEVSTSRYSRAGDRVRRLGMSWIQGFLPFAIIVLYFVVQSILTCIPPQPGGHQLLSRRKFWQQYHMSEVECYPNQIQHLFISCGVKMLPGLLLNQFQKTLPVMLRRFAIRGLKRLSIDRFHTAICESVADYVFYVSV